MKSKLVKKDSVDSSGKPVTTFWLGDEQVCVDCHGEQFPHIHVKQTQEVVKEAA
jgi:hypothetical protein